MTSVTNLMTVTETHDIIYWPLIDLKDTLYDQLLNRVTSDNHHWMTWMTILMTSHWIAWHQKKTLEWLEWQSLWLVTEAHDIIWWPLNELNDNTYDQLLNRMTSYNDHWMTWMTILMTSWLNHMTYNDQWMTMTNLKTRYWNAWHHIMNIKWLEWQSLWPVTESRDII